MAVNFASVLQASRSLKQGVYLLRVLRNIRDFTTAVAIELDQKSGVKNNLLDAYRKKRIIDETALDGQGPTKCKDLKELVEKERQKVVARYKETELHQGTWTEKSRRAGAVGKKIGMSLLWKKDGRPIRVTLIQMKDCQVLDSRLGVDDGGINHHTEVIVGSFNEDDLSKLNEGEFGQYVKYGIPSKKKLRGFPVTKDALLPSGTPISAAHFVPGQFLMINGISKKHGFQGVMKRWGMKGQPRSHGQTKTHRKMGATGGGGSPGRIFPGKRMAGHMGGNKVTLPSVKLYRINTLYNILYVSGQIPGEVGDFVKIQDSFTWKQKFPVPPPFPTFIPDPENVLPEDIYADEIHQYTEESFSYKGDA